jgi:hypothetical protein
LYEIEKIERKGRTKVLSGFGLKASEYKLSKQGFYSLTAVNAEAGFMHDFIMILYSIFLCFSFNFSSSMSGLAQAVKMAPVKGEPCIKVNFSYTGENLCQK